MFAATSAWCRFSASRWDLDFARTAAMALRLGGAGVPDLGLGGGATSFFAPVTFFSLRETESPFADSAGEAILLSAWLPRVAVTLLSFKGFDNLLSLTTILLSRTVDVTTLFSR